MMRNEPGTSHPDRVEHFGEFLVARQALTEEQLYDALMHQEENPEMSLGECCIELGFLEEDEIEAMFLEFQSGADEEDEVVLH